MRRRAFSLILVFAWLPIAASAQIIAYVDDSNRERLGGEFDVRLSGAAASLDADMLVTTRDGATSFTPRITTNWAASSRLDISTTLKAGDLNGDARASVDTRLALRPALRFIDRVEANLRRGSTRAQESLKLGFAELDTGLGLFGGQTLGLRLDLEHAGRGDRAVTSSSLRSRFGLGDAVRVQADLKLDNSGTAGFTRSHLQTRIAYRTPFALIQGIEGELERRPNGKRQSLAVTLPEIARDFSDDSAYRLTGKALLREIEQADGHESRRIGFETRFSGLFASPLGGRNSLKLDLERGLGSEDLRSASLSYSHEWTPTAEARIELGLETKRRNEVTEPAMDLRWSARF